MIGLLINRAVWLAGSLFGKVGAIPGLSSFMGPILPMAAVGVTVWAIMSLNHWGEESRIRAEEHAACERRVAARIDEFAKELNDEADARIRRAREGAKSVLDAKTLEEINAVCGADKNCREHGK